MFHLIYVGLYVIHIHADITPWLNTRWCLRHFVCARHVFLCALVSRLVCARARAQLRGNSGGQESSASKCSCSPNSWKSRRRICTLQGCNAKATRALNCICL